jgi:thiamine-phosphate pyrophosphorylase
LLRFTDTKKNLSPIVGLEGYKRILSQFRTLGHNLPVVGIGGVKADDIEALLEVGLHGVAVSSLVNLAENPSAVTEELLSLLSLALSEVSENL